MLPFSSIRPVVASGSDNERQQVLCKPRRAAQFCTLAVLATSSLALTFAPTYQGPNQPPYQKETTIPMAAAGFAHIAKDFPVPNSTVPELTPEQHSALLARVVPRLRMLSLVIDRLPRTFQYAPGYTLTYYVEKLQCGHEVIFYPQSGSFTKRRLCQLCTHAALLASLPPKKPVVAESLVEEVA